MQRFEITVGGRAEGDFATHELADAAAVAARATPENKDKQVHIRPKVEEAVPATQAAGSATPAAPAAPPGAVVTPGTVELPPGRPATH